MNSGKKSDWQPDFIGVGAERCATTWCWYCLNEHPEICVTHPKEVHYFDRNYDKGEKWYRLHFSCDNNQIMGEINPLYMYSPVAARRIAHDYPDTNILLILRNPFERTMDRLFLDLQNVIGGIDNITLAQAKQLAKTKDDYLERSLYFKYLSPYFDYFDRENIIILYYDDLKSDHRNFLSNLYRSLGADPYFIPPSADKAINIAGNYRWPLLFFSLQKVSRTAKKYSVTNRLLEWVNRNLGIREWFFRVATVNKGKPDFKFMEVFCEADRDLILQDLENLAQILKVRVPVSWINDIA
ncbi:MAG: sulfotransferase domain-containing protein [candidate division WOR-3 bacterium]